MKKKTKAFLLALCGLVFVGCQKTPEEEIVRQKGADSIKAYQAAEDSQEGEKGENALAERLQVPELYEAKDASEDGTYSMTASAEVVVPDVSEIDVWRVHIREDSQEMMETIQAAFLGDAPVYDAEAYHQQTKEEVERKLEELKGYQAAGNLDPYGYREAMEESARAQGEEIDLDTVYNLQDDIDYYESLYAEAPEEIQKIEVEPKLEGIDGLNGGYTEFRGVAETEQAAYNCSYATERASDKFYAEIMRLGDVGGNFSYSWRDGMYDVYEEEESDGDGPDYPSREEAEEMAGITKEEAIQQADAYVEKLGDEGLVMNTALLCLHNKMEGDMTEHETNVYDNAGYMLHYTREAGGFSVSYEENEGGGLEDMDSTNDTSCYERLTVVINGDGLQYVQMADWYELGEKNVENVELKTFPEIAGIFEQMMRLKNADTQAGTTETFEIREVRLGYMRIYDPGKSVMEGLLVPVWDFYGIWKYTTEYEGETYGGVRAAPYMSLLTVNAIDGTVIDRSLGY